MDEFVLVREGHTYDAMFGRDDFIRRFVDGRPLTGPPYRMSAAELDAIYVQAAGKSEFENLCSDAKYGNYVPDQFSIRSRGRVATLTDHCALPPADSQTIALLRDRIADIFSLHIVSP